MTQLAVVTGVGEGIGRAIATHLVAEGYAVFAIEKNARLLDDLREELNGRDFAGVVGDVTDYDQMASVVDALVKARGCPWLLVNNVGGDLPAPFLETSPEGWRRLVELNFLSALTMDHLLIPHMQVAGGGRIIHMSSDSARFGVPSVSVYAGMKGALISFSKCIAKEFAKDNILVNCICPGSTDTPALRAAVANRADGQAWVDAIVAQVPLGRIGQADDYAPMVSFLAGRGGDYITGQSFSVNGGKSMV